MSAPADPVGFDRLRPRRSGSAAAGGTGPGKERVDVQGKRALFSPHPRAIPTRGSVAVRCSSCGATTVLGMLSAARLLVPSIHLPLRRYPSLVRCPSCGRPSWTKLRLRL